MCWCALAGSMLFFRLCYTEKQNQPISHVHIPSPWPCMELCEPAPRFSFLPIPSVRKHKHCPPRRNAGPQNNEPTKRYTVHIIIFFSKSEFKMDKKPKGRATVKMIDFRELVVAGYNIRCGYRCVSSARGGDAIRCVCKHSYRAHTMRWLPATRSAVYFSNERYWPV